MITTHEWLAGVISDWGPRVADHLWQSTLFAIIVLAACLVLRRGPARLRHSLWLVAALKFIVPIGLFVSLTERSGITLEQFSAAFDSQLNVLIARGMSEPVTVLADSYQVTVVASSVMAHNEIICAVALIWLTGVVTFLGTWAIRRQRFLGAMRRGRRLTQGREWQALEQAREALGWNQGVELVISSHNTDPAVCRVWKPVVLLPQAIAEHLDDVELEAIMLHEVVHIRRRDNLIGNIQMVICALLWFHPLVWFISSKLFDERELACDEEVLKVRGAPEVYASSILKVVRFSLGWRVAGVTGAGSGSNLRRRIENIMSTNNNKRGVKAWHRLLATSVLSLAMVLMIIAGVRTQARDANGDITVQALQEAGTAQVPIVEPMIPMAQTDKKAPLPAKPPTPPAPPQVVAPAAPAADTNETPATAPSAPVAPTAATPATPASPAAAPVAPVAPAKEKSKSKDKDKQKDAKRKVEKGKLIEAPPPVYPPDAKEQKIEGLVSVEIVINEEGNVISAKPGSGPEALHGAARDAALKARFRPTLVDGKAAKVAGAMSYNFVLDKK